MQVVEPRFLKLGHSRGDLVDQELEAEPVSLIGLVGSFYFYCNF